MSKKNPVIHTEVFPVDFSLPRNASAADRALQRHHNGGKLYPADQSVPHLREQAWRIHAVHRIYLRVWVRADGSTKYCVVAPPAEEG